MDEGTKRRIEETVLDLLRHADLETVTENKVRSAAAEKLRLDLSTPDCKLFVRNVVESFLVSQNNDDADADADAGDAAADPQRDGGVAAEGQQLEGDQVRENKEEAEEEQAAEEHSHKRLRRSGPREYNDDGDLIICRLSGKRKVTLQNFKGRMLVSIREYYTKDGKELPSSKGISLSVEQWEKFRDSVPAIVSAINRFQGSD